MSRPRLLVTGGTGFLGRSVVEILEQDFEVDVLSRSSLGQLRGDLTLWNAGLESLPQKKYAALLHLAGLYDLTASEKECYLQNVLGTSQALRLCDRLKIPVFLNTSSVAAGINSTRSSVAADELNFEFPFPDPYSQTKAQAERLVRDWEGAMRLKVNLRPGVLVGDSVRGRIQRIDGPYYAPQALKKLKNFLEAFPGPLPLPGEKGRSLPLLPVDACARGIVGMLKWALDSKEGGSRSFHLVPAQGLEISAFYRSVLKHLLIRHKGLVLVHQVPDWISKKVSNWAFQFPEAQLNYLLKFPHFDSVETRKILGDHWCPEFEDYERAFWSGYENFVSNR